MNNNNNNNGINIINPFGRTGNHIITLAHGIYICRKYNTKWIKLDNDFIKTGIGGGGNIWIDAENIKAYTNETLPLKPNELEPNLKKITSYMIFHLSQFLGDNNGKIDINYYKELYECIYPLIRHNISLLTHNSYKFNNDNNNINDILKQNGLIYKNNIERDEKILYTHLKFTDNLVKNLNHKYNVLPINYYVKLMNLFKFDALIIVTDNNNSLYINEINDEINKQCNKKVIVLKNLLYQDFNTLINAKYLAMDLSTFTWTAHLLSSKKQIVFVWEQFFTRFLLKYKHYVNISVFNLNDVSKNYYLFNLEEYIDCGDWLASDENIKSCLSNGWNNNIKWYNENNLSKLIKLHTDNILKIDSGQIDSGQIDELNLLKLNENKCKCNINNDKSNRIALIGPGIMSIPPKGWGAVEILIWEYYQELTKLGWSVDIINTPDKNEIIKKINNGNYGFIHLHYDKFYDILDKFNDKNIIIAFTTHYPYIQQKEQHMKDGYSNIYKFMINQDKYWNVIINDKDKNAMIMDGASKKWFHQIKNGASSLKIKCIKTISNDMMNKTICLGWITKRKRQRYLLEMIVKELNIDIDFAGRKSDELFDYNDKHYIGEWSKEEVYTKLTHYPNMILLSGGEADPLVIKEGLMAGCGIVITESSAAHLDKTKPWITIIPVDKENDNKYIANAILKNRLLCIKNQNTWRQEIREYAEEYFSNTNIIKDYSNWVRLLVKNKPKICLVGTGISEIPAKGWGAVEGIVWEYYQLLQEFNFDVKIVNCSTNDKLNNIKQMINDINSLCPDIIHIFYDDRIDIIPFIKCKPNTRIFYTSHWAYLPQIKTIKKFIERNNFAYADSYINGIFKKAVTNHHKIEYLLISNEIGNIYKDFGVPEDKINIIHNGANSNKFVCKYIDEMKYTNSPRAICLGKIDQRKRQSQLKTIDFLWFAGNIADNVSDNEFNNQHPRYLGEWTREQVYNELTDYSTVVLLSDGEADPLTVKEAFMAGCGVVVSEYAAANLDITKPWITIIPNTYIDTIPFDDTSLKFIEKSIQENIVNSVKYRNEIRKYGEMNFDWKNIIYDKYFNVIFKQK